MRDFLAEDTIDGLSKKSLIGKDANSIVFEVSSNSLLLVSMPANVRITTQKHQGLLKTAYGEEFISCPAGQLSRNGMTDSQPHASIYVISLYIERCVKETVPLILQEQTSCLFVRCFKIINLSCLLDQEIFKQ